MKQKVAVLGGGMGSLSAAFWLTSKPGWQDEYEVTVYSLGWRLGGKAAAGRRAGQWQRTEEHGFHMLFGFYENAFKTMRACYDELGRSKDAPLAEFCAIDPDDEQRFPDRYAVKRNSDLFLAEQFNGAYQTMAFRFPENDLVPGSGPLADIYDCIRGMVEALCSQAAASAKTAGPASTGMPGWLGKLEALFLEAAGDVFGLGLESLSMLDGPLIAVARLLEHLPSGARFLGDVERNMDRLFDTIAQLVRGYLKDLWALIGSTVDSDWDSYCAWVLQDFIGCNLIGILEDNVPFAGFDSLNGQNYYDWILAHAAVPEGTQKTVSSTLVQFAYDACFAYEGGDAVSPRTEQKPVLGQANMEAGTMLRGGMRMFATYKGAVDWLFQSGCGDALVAPMYEVLARRGVQFALFHVVTDIVSKDGEGVDTIQMERQVDLKVGTYQPLQLVNGLPVWPMEPLYDQIVQGDELRARNVDLESYWTDWRGTPVTLQRGRDFDQVILGISHAALHPITQSLARHSQPWRDMLDHIQTTRTIGFQAWLTESSESLGWRRGRIAGDTAVEPANMEAEATQVVARESWPQGQTPQNLTYFGGLMKDDPDEPAPPSPGYPATQNAVVRDGAVSFLNNAAAIFWPKSGTIGAFNWDLLAAPGSTATGEERFDTQFWLANIDPTERYVLSLVGTTKYRLATDKSVFSNLFLAGDWIRTGLNCGCMEGTVTSGMLASNALCGYPAKVPDESDFLAPSIVPSTEEPSLWSRLSGALFGDDA